MKTLFQIKETSASSVRHCCRVLSLIAVLTAFSSSAWAETYYLDGRSIPQGGFVAQWVQNKQSTNLTYYNNTPENAMVQFDFTFDSGNNEYFKFSAAWSGSYCQINQINSSEIAGYNCIKILSGDKSYTTITDAINAGAVKLTNYGQPEVSISSVTGGDRQLTVNWSVTGMTPTSQTVQYKVSGSGAYQDGPTVSASATSATITGLTNGTEYTVKVTATDGTDSPFAEQTGTPSAQLLLPVLTGSGQTRQNNVELFVVIDGYPSTTYPQNKDKYSYENVSGTPAIDRIQDAAAGYLYFVLNGSTTSGERVYKITCTENNACAKLTFADGKTVPTVGPCSEAPTPTETPIVYWEKYPTIGNNTIDMFGYLAERWCSPVTDAGFYWKETNDITASDIETPAENHKFQAAANPAKNNDSFSKTTPDLSEIITEPTTIYLVNYVTTAGGGTGISDVVALAYSPCFPIPEGGVTLNNSAISLPEGYKFTFEATARSAGKTPVYKWYLDAEQSAIEAGTATPIEGATSNTYEFTMPDASDHTLSVKVTGDCDASLIATANIQSCTAPTVSLGEDQSANPWTSVTITATQEGVTTAEWSVEPEAELSGTSTSGATFRAGTTGDYTVKYVGSGTACDSSVKAEATVKVTIIADSEDCTNPDAE